ncbi:mavicyanin-like [Miscanthus floridulus]|uniref:mavicyanin-like n=1 Tax=Miscanthus floridulus TaxID=154761 RepID=UPI00345963F1
MASSSVSRLPLAVLLLVACSSTAAATSYTVGDGSGWTTGVDYTSWASSKNFKVGDNLVFNYAKGLHTVVEVSAAEYMACTAANPLGSDNSGATTVALKTPGTHYFVCSITGHCGAGMKLAMTVGGSNSPATLTPTTPTTPYTTPTTPTTTTPYTTPTTPTCSGGGGTTATPGMTPFMSYPSAAGLGSAALAGFALVWCVIVQLALL